MTLRRSVYIVLLICMFFLLTGCAGLSDWDYGEIPGDYIIVRCNSQHIYLCKDEGSGGPILIKETVVAFCYNTKFIGLQRVPTTTFAEFDPEEVYASEAEFYLVDAETREIYGPLTEEAYNSKLVSLGVSDMGEWITTRTKPDGAN